MWTILLLLFVTAEIHAEAIQNTPPNKTKATVVVKKIPAQITPHFPFLKEFHRKKNLVQKLAHLKDWNRDMAKENDTDYFTFESLVRLTIFEYVNVNVLDCKEVHYDLANYLSPRYQLEDNAYIMFNEIVDDLCPQE